MSVEHYENFPVASWLCPPRLRPPIVAIYHFARTADDIADEGHRPANERVDLLLRFRDELRRSAAQQTPNAWPEVFVPLAAAIEAFTLPVPLLDDLLDAFIQDTSNPLLPDQQSVLAYCRRSANPIGRLLLHLYGITAPAALARSDAICSALQLINFWQDISVDHARGRCYLPADLCLRHSIDRDALLHGAPPGPGAHALMTELIHWTSTLMAQGEGLVHDIPGRAGWELRLVVQGGRLVLERIATMNPESFVRRPRIRAIDLPKLLWRAAQMSRPQTA